MRKLGSGKNLQGREIEERKSIKKVIRVLQNQELLAAKMKKTEGTGAL